MSSKDQEHQEYEIVTATAVHLRKIDSPARQTIPVRIGSPQSARDQQVTSAMPPHFSPYDRTTPPMTPRFYDQTIPRSPFYAQTPKYTRCPGAAAVWQPGTVFTQTAPRGYGPRDTINVVRPQDDYFNALHPHHSYSPPSSLQAHAAHRIPKMPTQQRQLPPRIVIPTNHGQGFPTITSKDLRIPLYSELEHKPKKSRRESVQKTTAWLAGMRKRSPNEIFNKNFGFDAASLRGPSDRTPQISPRTSLSKAAPPLSLSPSDSVKRQRVDSKSAETMQSLPSSKTTPTKSVRGNDLDSPLKTPQQKAAFVTPPTSRRDTMSTEDVHPGTPVNWDTPATNTTYTSPSNTHYPPITPSPRRRSFPSISVPAERKRSKEVAMLARLAVLDTTTKQFGTSKSATTPTGRKRACTLERKVRTSRKIAPGSTPTSATSTKSMYDRASRVISAVPALKRTTSDPSTDAFLKHVRASLEKRRSRDAKEKGRDVAMDYPVFADEHERGFLDDAPL